MGRLDVGGSSEQEVSRDVPCLPKAIPAGFSLVVFETTAIRRSTLTVARVAVLRFSDFFRQNRKRQGFAGICIGKLKQSDRKADSIAICG